MCETAIFDGSYGKIMTRYFLLLTICYRVPISAVMINEQLLGEKGTCAKLQNDITNTEGLVRVLYRLF